MDKNLRLFCLMEEQFDLNRLGKVYVELRALPQPPIFRDWQAWETTSQTDAIRP